MSKRCYICGHEITEDELYFSAGGNTYVCSNPSCYPIFFWDLQAARFVVDSKHEYAVINHKLYRIGSNDDDTRGMGGEYYAIRFNDGHFRDTRSLWFIGEVPLDKRKIFKENAKFIQKG